MYRYSMARSAALVLLFSGLCFARPGGVIPIQEVFEPTGTFDPAKYGKVAVLQWNQSTPTPVGVSAAEAEDFKQANREIIADYARRAGARGAEMVITPEFSIVGYPSHPEIPPEQDNFLNREEVAPYVETVPGPSTQYFGRIAREGGFYLHIGLAEVDRKSKEYFNTVVVLGPNGRILAKYRKIHLYGGESRFLSAGKDPVIYQSAFGRVGIVICSDIYSNHPMDNYTDKLDVLALSTSWAAWNTGMSAFQRGAKWVHAPVLAANQTYFPDSGVINADGSKQSHIRQSTGLAYGYLPRKP